MRREEYSELRSDLRGGLRLVLILIQSIYTIVNIYYELVWI